MLSGMKDKHWQARAGFMNYLGIVINQARGSPIWDVPISGGTKSLRQLVHESIAETMADKEGETRKACRNAFVQYKKSWKGDADDLFQTFDARTQVEIFPNSLLDLACPALHLTFFFFPKKETIETGRKPHCQKGRPFWWAPCCYDGCQEKGKSCGGRSACC